MGQFAQYACACRSSRVDRRPRRQDLPEVVASSGSDSCRGTAGCRYGSAGQPRPLQFHPEYGASQFELSLAPGTALEAADRLVRARLVIQRVSRRYGRRCSFSPKPSLERVGNGGHVHFSVRHQGQPLLEGGAGVAGLTEAGQQLLATLLAELPALMALACPQGLSYGRLGPSSWSAPFQVWGVENREAALLLIPGAADGAAAHLELKVSDLGANPYLLLGAVQLLVRQGLAGARTLPPPCLLYTSPSPRDS